MSEYDHLLNEPITWHDTGEAKWMWRARHESHDLSVYLNDDWPDELTYGVYVDGTHVYDIEGWPIAWTQVRGPGASRGST